MHFSDLLLCWVTNATVKLLDIEKINGGLTSDCGLCRHCCSFLHSYLYITYCIVGQKFPLISYRGIVYIGNFKWISNLSLLSACTLHLSRHVFESDLSILQLNRIRQCSRSPLYNLAWLLYAWVSVWLASSHFLGLLQYVNFHACDASLKRSCSQRKRMARLLREVWVRYATGPPYCCSVRGHTLTCIAPSTFLNKQQPHELEPLCTWNEVLAGLRSLPAVFHWAEFISRRRISIRL